MLDFMQGTTDLIGTEDVAAIFGVDRSTVTRWVQSGKLTPALSTPGMYLFDRSVIEALAEEQAS
jgi:predicted site-specific integrase-resolvase